MKEILNTIYCISFGVLFVIACGLYLENKTLKAEQPKLEVADCDLLLDAIAIVESNNNPNAVGDNGRAIGMYQIHKAYWRDGTRFLGVDWPYRDAFDPVKARAVTKAYLEHYGRGLTIEQKAKIHNGGPKGHLKESTIKYWQKVGIYLKEN